MTVAVSLPSIPVAIHLHSSVTNPSSRHQTLELIQPTPANFKQKLCKCYWHVQLGLQNKPKNETEIWAKRQKTDDIDKNADRNKTLSLSVHNVAVHGGS
jgi:hypothetical protein